MIVGDTFCPRGAASIKRDLLLLDNVTQKDKQKTKNNNKKNKPPPPTKKHPKHKLNLTKALKSVWSAIGVCALTNVPPRTSASEGTPWAVLICPPVDLPVLGTAREESLVRVWSPFPQHSVC